VNSQQIVSCCRASESRSQSHQMLIYDTGRAALTMLAVAASRAPAARCSRSGSWNEDDNCLRVVDITASGSVIVAHVENASNASNASVLQDTRSRFGYSQAAATLVPVALVDTAVDQLRADIIQAKGHHRWHHQALIERLQNVRPGIQEAAHGWQTETDPPPQQLLDVVARGLGITQGERCSTTLPPATYMGCANGCDCNWGQRCYAKYLELGGLSTDGGMLEHDNVQINIGVCQLAPASLVLISFTIFLISLSSVVLLRMYLQWREFKALQILHNSADIHIRLKGSQPARKTSTKNSQASPSLPTGPSHEAQRLASAIGQVAQESLPKPQEIGEKAKEIREIVDQASQWKETLRL